MENKFYTQDIVREISDKLQYYHQDVRAVMDCFASLVANHVQQGDSIYCAKLGTFSPQRSRGAGTLAVKFRPATALLREGVESK
jgi:nucleoid DNA-binding protein